MNTKNTDVDDGYRGLLLNPATGQVFLANEYTATRPDLVRVKSVDDKPVVVKSVDAVVADAKEPESDDSDDDSSEAKAAMDELMARVEATDDKEALKAMGAEVGLKLSGTMSEATMRDRIAKQVELIRGTPTGAE